MQAFVGREGHLEEGVGIGSSVKAKPKSLNMANLIPQPRHSVLELVLLLQFGQLCEESNLALFTQRVARTANIDRRRDVQRAVRPACRHRPVPLSAPRGILAATPKGTLSAVHGLDEQLFLDG